MPKINVDVRVPDGEHCEGCAFLNFKTLPTNSAYLLQEYCLLYNKPIFSAKKVLDCQAAARYYSKTKKESYPEN